MQKFAVPPLFFRRLTARLIDYAVVLAALGAIIIGLGLALRFLEVLSDTVDFSGYRSVVIILGTLAAVVLAGLAAPAWWNLRTLRRSGQSVGKRLAGLRIVAMEAPAENAPALRVVLLRMIAPAVPTIGGLFLYMFAADFGASQFMLNLTLYPLVLLYYAGRYGSAFFDADGRAWHDHLARTRVVER